MSKLELSRWLDWCRERESNLLVTPQWRGVLARNWGPKTKTPHLLGMHGVPYRTIFILELLPRRGELNLRVRVWCLRWVCIMLWCLCWIIGDSTPLYDMYSYIWVRPSADGGPVQHLRRLLSPCTSLFFYYYCLFLLRRRAGSAASVVPPWLLARGRKAFFGWPFETF